jgi:replicative DNA helicase
MAPHDLHAEAAVLRACLTTRDGATMVSDVVEPNHFYSESHKWVFRAIYDLWEGMGRVNPVSVIGRLKDLGRLGQVTPELVHEIANGSTALSSLDARAAAERVRTLSCDRDLLWSLEEASARLRAGYEDRGAFIETISAAVHKAAERTDLADEDVSVSDAAQRVLKAIESSERRAGVSYGFTALDQILVGLRPGELTILAARPGMAKSALALSIALSVAATGTGVMFYTLEMTQEEVASRAMASYAKLNMRAIQRDGLNPDDGVKARGVARFIAQKFSTLRVDQRSLTVNSLRSRVTRAATKFRTNGKKLGLVVLDYFQLVSGGAGESENDRLERAINGTKRLAVELGVPILALSQLSREVEKDNRKPRPSDLRGSGGLEQAANNIMFIHRGQRDEPVDREVVEIIVAKQRDGDTGSVFLAFERKFTRFEDAREEEIRAYLASRKEPVRR